VLPTSFDVVARACAAMVAAASRPSTEADIPAWQRVKRMQCMSYYHLLSLLLEGTGMRNVERLFDNDVVSGGSPTNKGCARKLRRGKHLPGMETLTRNALHLARLRREDFLPRLHADCYQLLWLALLVDRPMGERARDYTNVHHWYDMERPFGMLQMLSGITYFQRFSFPRASLPMLAGLVVVLRRAVELKRESDAHLIAMGLCRVLLLLGIEFQRRGIAAPLFQYFEEHVLPLGGVHVPAAQLARASAFLNLLAMSTSQRWESPTVEWSARSAMMLAILDGNFGPDLQHLCGRLEAPKSRTQWQELSAGQLHWSTRERNDPPCENVSIEALLRLAPEAEYWIFPQVAVKSGPTMRSWCADLFRA
jgi:hypothetical protein